MWFGLLAYHPSAKKKRRVTNWSYVENQLNHNLKYPNNSQETATLSDLEPLIWKNTHIYEWKFQFRRRVTLQGLCPLVSNMKLQFVMCLEFYNLIQFITLQHHEALANYWNGNFIWGWWWKRGISQICDFFSNVCIIYPEEVTTTLLHLSSQI